MKEKEKVSGRCFRFKEFSVQDDRCGMKLGTDGVLLGAWAGIRKGSRVLDIGAGCGILALMAAQKGAEEVTCIEIDQDAACQCRENAQQSPWKERIRTLCGDFFELCKELPRFDHLISNPPFYAEQLRAPDQARSMARQGQGLDCAGIIRRAPALLEEGGLLSLICPTAQKEEILFESTLARLSLARLTELCSAEGREPIRHLWEFSLTETQPVIDRLAIRDLQGNYTAEYAALVRDYYLNIG